MSTTKTTKQLIPCAACSKAGTLVCSGCHLVKYCSKNCQIQHRGIHKSTCKSSLPKDTWNPAWVREDRQPAFMDSISSPGPPGGVHHGIKKYLIGNTPAVDMISLVGLNGRENLKMNLDILFAASGDLRNVIASLNNAVRLDRPIHIVLNDLEPYAVVRNLILLLLLSSNLELGKVIEAAIHLWFSAFLTEEMVDTIKQACELLGEGTMPWKAVHDGDSKPSDIVHSLLKLQSGLLINVDFPCHLWKTFYQVLGSAGKLHLQAAKKARHAITLAPFRVDYRDRHLCNIPQEFRMARMKFWDDGILLPYGSSRDHFTQPNFTLFNDNGKNWLCMDSYDPCHAFDILSVIKENHSRPVASRAPPADIDGALYLHIHDFLYTFTRHLKDYAKSTTFAFIFGNAVDLQSHLPSLTHLPQSFDIIDVSNIIDACNPNSTYLGIGPTLLKIGKPLLKPDGHLTSLFMNYPPNLDAMTGGPADAKSATTDMAKYFGPTLIKDVVGKDIRGGGIARMMDMMSYFRDYNSMWNSYSHMMNMYPAMESAGMGLEKIETRWKLDIGERRDRKKVLEDMKLMALGGMSGWENLVVFDKLRTT